MLFSKQGSWHCYSCNARIYYACMHARTLSLTHVHTHTHTHAHTSTHTHKHSVLVDCNMCRFRKMLLFSLFFFCKDGSDRLMKRASFSCCNFLCVLCLLLLTCSIAGIAGRACHSSGTFFFHCDTHTHTHARKHMHTCNTHMRALT